MRRRRHDMVASVRGGVPIVACGCGRGDNVIPVAAPLQHSGVLFLVGHTDDDMIFMQPELLDALRTDSTTTVYATTAGPNGSDRHLFESAKIAYGSVVGSTRWDCGLLELADVTV